MTNINGVNSSGNRKRPDYPTKILVENLNKRHNGIYKTADISHANRPLYVKEGCELGKDPCYCIRVMLF